MAQAYFKDFWIVTNKGEKLYPTRIKSRETGVATYRILADGSNRQEDGKEIADAVEAIRLFLAYSSLRFGNEKTKSDNRFKRGSNFVANVDATSAFKAAHPTLRW